LLQQTVNTKEERMPVQGLFGTTVELLGKTLDLRAKRHELIVSNIANVETPNYTPTDLSFEGELRNALKNGGNQTNMNSRHLPLKGGSVPLSRVTGEVVEIQSKNVGPDGNGVEMEAEMGRMVENQILYNSAVQLLSKKMEMMKQAIRGTL
jgi:flagellar basal-body rod protein FlgB